MRSVIEEIAAAEQLAEEIRFNATVQARELTLQAREDAQAALIALESEERNLLHSELEAAKLEGGQLSGELLQRMQQEADALCTHATDRLDKAVTYLLDKVTKTA
jgi:hypothetical protein